MSFEAFIPTLPVAATGLLMTYKGFSREVRKRRAELRARRAAENVTLPPGALALRTSVLSASPDTSGKLMVVAIGTAGVNQGLQLAQALDLNQQHAAVGSFFFVEADQRKQAGLQGDIPDSYKHKTVFVDFPASLSGGLNNAPPELVLSEPYVRRWGPPTQKAVRQVCELHQMVNRGISPSTLLLNLSGGGMASTGPLVVREIRKYFPMVKIYGFVTFPTFEVLRERVPHLLELYKEAGLSQWFAADNLGEEPRNDYGMRVVVESLITSPQTSYATPELNNSLFLLFGSEPGVVRYFTWLRHVPAYLLQPTHPTVRPLYAVPISSLVDAIHTGLDEVNVPTGSSLPELSAAPPKPGSTQMVMVMAGVESLAEIQDDIATGEALAGLSKLNRQLAFATTTVPLEDRPPIPRCPVAVIRMELLAEGFAAISHITSKNGVTS